MESSENTQFHNELIDISKWRMDPTYDGVFAKGSREKAAYFSPENPAQNCLIPKWRYLFKLPRSLDWCPYQFWIEIIAYRLGILIGVPVPPANAAVSMNYEPGKKIYGALIEWFYNEQEDIYIDGGRLMSWLIKDFDREEGSQHNWQTIYSLRDNIGNTLEHWAGLFTLDSLISNTDRHQDNWGWILKGGRINPQKHDLYYAPAFDNGTSLGYNIREEDFTNTDKVDKYLNNAKYAHHHIKWSMEEDKRISFETFVKNLVVQSPEVKPIIERHLEFSAQQLEELLSPLTYMVTDNHYKLTRTRLEFMLYLITQRKHKLKEVLKQCN